VLRAYLTILLGSITTLAIHGYQFGQGNQTIYLLDALRRTEPALLRNDWFLTQTLQYHAAFTLLAETLLRLKLLQPAFVLGYVALIGLFHIAWRGIVRTLGGDDTTYLASVALYYFSAAGTALGMYQFFQDSALLPSNIANVAMLWAIYLWLSGRQNWAGICLGVAGIFHLNHAVVGVAVGTLLVARSLLARPCRRLHIAGMIGAILPGAINIALAAHAKLMRSGSMPLEQFIDLYVRVRHPHHYDPSSWPAGIWIAFLWSIPPGLLALRGEARRIMLGVLAMIAVALLGAGAWFCSETLVQMSLYRFSIYAQLLACAGTSLLLITPDRKRVAMFLSRAALLVMIAVCSARGPFFGLFRMPRDDNDYIKLCQWISANTDRDAVFLVPPDEQSMRLIGRRAIVINYKAVPQLSGELPQWQRRLAQVLDLPDLRQLPRGYSRTLAAIRQRYDSLPAEHLIAVAQQYGARYIVTSRPLEALELQRMKTDAFGSYALYDLRR